MENLKLGQIITTEQHRDAIHIAIAPVTATERMSPSQHVGIDEQGRATSKATKIGVVDPFLTRAVNAGERFWLFLYPGSITSLRHSWTHPAFASVRSQTPVPTMDARRAFLAEIALAPDDPTPHRIYADWLEENGEIEEAHRHRTWTVERARAELQLRSMADRYRIGYQELIDGAASGEGGCFGDDDGPQATRDYQFWEWIEAVTGKEFSDEHRDNTYFRCAC